MRLLFTAAVMTAAAIALMAPGTTDRLVSGIWRQAADTRVDADLGFHAPSNCQTRTILTPDGHRKAVASRVRICS